MTSSSIYLAITENEMTSVDAGQAILALAGSLANPVWLMVQSYQQMNFCFFHGSIPGFETSLSGRVFNAQQEIRWTRENDKVRTWTISEVAQATPDALVCRSEALRYYLWGTWRADRFEEAKIPRHLVYPLRVNTVPKENDRAYVMACEYLPTRPAAYKRENLDQWMAALNQPRVLAYRLFDVGCGADDASKCKEM